MIDVIGQWNYAAQKYTEDQEQSECAERNKRVVKARLKQFSGGKRFGSGCGYGFGADYFRSIGAEAVEVDASEKMIEIARDRYPQAGFSVMDITEPLSGYFNAAAQNGFVLKQTAEPVSYDGKNRDSDLPLFFFAEYVKGEVL